VIVPANLGFFVVAIHPDHALDKDAIVAWSISEGPNPLVEPITLHGDPNENYRIDDGWQWAVLQPDRKSQQPPELRPRQRRSVDHRRKSTSAREGASDEST
jgi:hypothetical protein